MKTIPSIKKRWNISRVPAAKYFKKQPAAFTKQQASVIATYLNSSIDTTLTVDDILANTKNYVFESHIDDPEMIVGAAHFTRKDWERCSINNIFVSEAYRKQGYGKKLLAKIEERASYRDFKILETFTSENDESLNYLLEKAGYNKNNIYFDEYTRKSMFSWYKDVPKPKRPKIKVPVMS